MFFKSLHRRLHSIFTRLAENDEHQRLQALERSSAALFQRLEAIDARIAKLDGHLTEAFRAAASSRTVWNTPSPNRARPTRSSTP
jgi:hypothetical protein